MKPSDIGPGSRAPGVRRVRVGGHGSAARSSMGCVKSSMNTFRRSVMVLQSQSDASPGSPASADDLLAVDGAAVHQAGDGESIQPKVTGPVREFRVDVGEPMGDRFLPCSSPCAARGALVAEGGGDEVTGLAQGRENEVGVGTDGGGAWTVTVGSGARVPKRRIAAPATHRLASLLRWATAGGPEPHSPCSRI
jgi:hypothetical protein